MRLLQRGRPCPCFYFSAPQNYASVTLFHFFLTSFYTVLQRVFVDCARRRLRFQIGKRVTRLTPSFVRWDALKANFRILSMCRMLATVEPLPNCEPNSTSCLHRQRLLENEARPKPLPFVSSANFETVEGACGCQESVQNLFSKYHNYCGRSTTACGPMWVVLGF